MSKGFLLLSMLFLLAAGKSLAQNVITINVLNPPENIAPGGYLTLFYEVRTDFDVKKDSLIVPENWHIILSKKQTKKKFHYSFIVTVAISQMTSAGQYPLTLLLFDANGRFCQKTSYVTIDTYRKIDVQAISSFDYAKEGDTLQIAYLIQNEGNTLEKLKLQSSSGVIGADNQEIEIAANKTIQVNVRQFIPKTSNNYWVLSSDLKVWMADSTRPIISLTNVPVYSYQNKKNDPYLRFPIEVGGAYNHFETGGLRYASYQYSIKGAGFLDFKNQHFLDFTIQGPNQVYSSAMGTYDLYSLQYSYKKTNIELGDYVLSLNNLMEYGRFGRGFRLDQSFKKIGVVGFYSSPRFYPNQKETGGFSIYYKPKANLRFSFDFLSKNTFSNDTWFNAKLLGLTLRYQGVDFRLTTELSGSLANNTRDFAGFNRIYYQLDRFHFSSDLIYAGKNFYGFYHNSWQAVNGLTYQINKKVSLALQSNYTHVNPSYDFLSMNLSPYFSNNSILFNYEFKSNNRLMLSYNIEEKEDRKDVQQFHFRDNYGRVAYLNNSPKVNLWFESRFGETYNYLLKAEQQKNTSLRISVQPQFRVVSWLWLGSFLEYQRTAKFIQDNVLTNYYFYGASSRILFGSKFNMSFSYRNNYAPDELVQQRSFIDMRAELQLNEHKLSLSVGQAFIPTYGQTNDNSLFFTIKYAVRINTPLVKNKHLGAIRGRVSNVNGISTQGVLVQLGNKKFLTDVNGNFFFNDLIPDSYYLSLDKSTLQEGLLTKEALPLQVAVKPNKTTKVPIPVVESGGIKGAITLVENQKKSDLVKEKLTIWVKIANDKETLYTKVQENGSFGFKELKPGQWQIDVSIQGNTDRYQIENFNPLITIETDTDTDLSYTVKVKERKIMFSNKNFQLNSKK